MSAAPGIAVYVERGSKRAFACAVDWPGWCRAANDEGSALQALVGSAPRYARAMARKRVRAPKPRDVSDLRVTSRHRGTATTDFGAPDVVPKADERPVGAVDLRTLSKTLEACWSEFDAMVERARGKALAKGPRGGGRALDAIVGHVSEAERGYLGALGWKAPPSGATAREIRDAVILGLAASARGEIPAVGPRGGRRWKPRHFARRLAWHALDHAWEIEDRAR